MNKLYLDDIRVTTDDSVLVKTVQEAKSYILKNGMPSFISFDHDLGENQSTGFDLAKWIVEQDLDQQGLFIPDDFTFRVHSQNPVGGRNIEMLLNNYLSQKD